MGPLTAPRWCDRYLAIPYLKGGRTPAGVDCYGQLRLVYAERLGIELPEHAVNPRNVRAVSRAFAAPFNRNDWMRVRDGSVRPYDGWLLWSYFDHERDNTVLRTVGHCGVIITPGLILHTDEKPGAMLARITDPCIAPRVHSRWRHRRLAE